MKIRFAVLIAIFFSIFICSSAYSFDGKRQGFILGGGLGFGATSFNQTVRSDLSNNTTPRLTKGSLATEFKIGYAPNERLEYFYSTKLSWFPIINIHEESVLILSGTETFGLTYSLSPSPPTFFVSAGIGFSSWETAFYTPADATWVGFGIFAGFGCEFARHYSMEFDISYGNPGDSDEVLWVKTRATSIMLKLNALAY